MNKNIKNTKNTDLNDEGKITARDHLVIQDKESGKIIFNKRETRGRKVCLTK